MDDSSLMFVERGIEVCFSGKEKVAIDYKIKEEMKKYFWETGNSLYYRITRSKRKGWFDRDFIRVPTSIEYELEKIINDILKD